VPARPAGTCYAVRLVAVDPLDEDSHALLIRLYRSTRDELAAKRQYAACAQLLTSQLGTSPGPAVRDALRQQRAQAPPAGRLMDRTA
jgi:DNA-binding SARP family transcriptional activator